MANMTDGMLKTALDETKELCISLIQRCKSEDETIAVALAFALEAKMIWTHFGGSRYAAVLFYSLADKCVGEGQQ